MEREAFTLAGTDWGRKRVICISIPTPCLPLWWPAWPFHRGPDAAAGLDAAFCGRNRRLFVISSAFPRDQGTAVLPQRRSVKPVSPSNQQDEVPQKSLKKVRFVSESVFNSTFSEGKTLAEAYRYGRFAAGWPPADREI